MAYARVRHASAYVGGRKVAEMFNNSYDVSSGDEPQFGDEGFVGMSDGAITTTFEFDQVVPTNGSSVLVENILLNKQDIDLAVGLINNKLHQVTVRCTGGTWKSDTKAGTLVGSFKFMGGVPKPV